MSLMQAWRCPVHGDHDFTVEPVEDPHCAKCFYQDHLRVEMVLRPGFKLVRWKRLREERPCPTCNGSGYVRAENMWGVTHCVTCGWYDGKQLSEYPGVAP